MSPEQAAAFYRREYERADREATRLAMRIAELEAALHYWSPYDDIEFAMKHAKARGELRAHK